jgi:hypothetical protein
MVASVEARDLEEDLASVDALIGDLVGGSEVEAMTGKTWDFGESVVTEKTIKKMEREGLGELSLHRRGRPLLVIWLLPI